MNSDRQHAPPRIRDAFLIALDEIDHRGAADLARYLTTCQNPLPSGTCLQLGLPAGSCYSAAANLILDEQPDSGAVAGRAKSASLPAVTPHSER